MKISELHKLFQSSNGICTDTRAIKEDSLFFALKGENFNGNKYASNAIEQGCSYAIIDEKEHLLNDKCILVDSVLKTLQLLANYHRKQFDIPVIAITGSNGKTTTKELVGEVLSKKYNTLMTKGNFNNHLGVPFTLLNLTGKHEIAIIEMGASKPGDIKELVEIAEPNFGMITNIGKAHIEGFGSVDGVIKTKLEMYDFISKTDGELFVNAQDELLQNNIKSTKSVRYGVTEANINGVLTELSPYVNFQWTDGDFKSEVLKTNLVGGYNFTNFLAAIAIGSKFEVDPLDISNAIIEYQPSNNRSQVTKTARNTLIVDCYNANPTSMEAAINSFDIMKSENKILILGDMLELGEISFAEHIKISELLERKKLKAILVGKEFLKIKSSFKTYIDAKELSNNEDLNDWQDQTVLLKGSRGIRLEILIENL